jgi:hypothetical protein
MQRTSQTGRLTGLWFFPKPALGLNTTTTTTTTTTAAAATYSNNNNLLQCDTEWKRRALLFGKSYGKISTNINSVYFLLVHNCLTSP